MMSPVPEEERHKPTQESSNEIEDTEYPDVVINADSSDSDGESPEEIGYMGYQVLSQDIGGPESGDDDEESGSEEDGQTGMDTMDPEIEMPASTGHQGLYQDFPNSTEQLPSYMQVPDVPRPDKTEMLWNQPRSTDIRLDTGQADKIKSLMSGIQLPTSNIPDWAKSLSDDQWQAQVVSKLVKQRSSQKQEVGDASSSKTVNNCDTDSEKWS